MKNLFLTLSIVFALASCDDGGVKEQGIIDPINEGLEYLTITYHLLRRNKEEKRKKYAPKSRAYHIL